MLRGLRFGPGGWWPRPDQAAVGALDRLPVDQWPKLAAKWLAAGFDSPVLRELASLPARDSRAELDALHLMPAALRSIGFDPAPADDEFTARCQNALDIVQHDLDVTGYGRYRMRACIGGGWPPAVFATLPDGSYWGGGQGMSRRLDGALLLTAAAESVSDVLKEVHEIEWPVCAVHGGHPKAALWEGEDPVGLIDAVAWWRCTKTGRALVPVGELTTTSGCVSTSSPPASP